MEEANTKKNELIGYILSQLMEDTDQLKTAVFGNAEIESLVSKTEILIKVSAIQTQQIDDLEKETLKLKDKVNVLETEDKKSRTKILIALILLFVAYTTASLPKLVTIIETIISHL